MKTSEEPLLQLLRTYQEANRSEKTILLRIPEIRLEVTRQLAEYEQNGRCRKVNQDHLDEILVQLRDPQRDPAEFRELLNGCRLPMEFWNRLRQQAESLKGEPVQIWKEAQRKACHLRNEILELTAYLVPKVRRLNFHIDEQKVNDADGNGFLGLIKAIDNFTETEGRLFEGYAKVYILNQIVTYLRNDKLVKPSENLRRFYTRHDHIVEELRQTLSREPTSQEIANALEINVEELFDKQELRSNTVSLDSEIGEDEEFTLHDVIGEEAALPYERIENHLVIDRLHEAMRSLSHGESTIVNLRWSPFAECPLVGPIHRAPEAYQEMRIRSFWRLHSALQKDAVMIESQQPDSSVH